MPFSRPNKWRARSANTPSLDNQQQPNPRPTTRLNTNKSHPTQATSSRAKPRHSRGRGNPESIKLAVSSAKPTSSAPSHVIPADAGTRIHKARHSPPKPHHPTQATSFPPQAASFPRTRESRIHKARRSSAKPTSSTQATSSRAKPPSFPRTRESRIHKARHSRAKLTSSRPKPRHSRGRGNPESISTPFRANAQPTHTMSSYQPNQQQPITTTTPSSATNNPLSRSAGEG